MEGIFYFGDQLRWNLGFETPNIAGAMVAVAIAFLLPFTSKIPDKIRRRFAFAVLFAVEISLWFVLAKTYSRGALVAAGICFVSCNAFMFFRTESKCRILGIALTKTVAVSAILLYTGFANRISPEYIGNDGSTSGRIALWTGGLKMVAQAPVCGWGVDKSGEEYINWYQDFSDERKYAGMVNSYLHITVERGLPALFAALSILAFPLFADFRLWRKNGDLFALALGLAMLSLCVSNIFSTLWVVSSIRYTGITIAAVSVIYAIFKGRKILAFSKIAILSISSAASICLCLYLAGLALQPKFISKHSDRITLAPDSPTDKRIAVIADKDTFGKYFGKTLRKAYVKATPETVLDVYCEIPQNAEGYDKFIITGKFAQTFQPPTSAKVVYINPIGNPPPPSNLTNATIYLPRFDIYNQNTKWINAAKKAKITHSFIETSSNQIPETTIQSEFSNRNPDRCFPRKQNSCQIRE